MRRPGIRLLLSLLGPCGLLVAGAALAHGVAGEDQDFMLRSSGPLVADGDPRVDAVAPRDGDPGGGQDVGDDRPPPGVRVGRRLEDAGRRRVADELQQHGLEDAARPAGAEQAPVGDRGDEVARSADGGQAQVGPVALGEAAHVHRA